MSPAGFPDTFYILYRSYPARIGYGMGNPGEYCHNILVNPGLSAFNIDRMDKEFITKGSQVIKYPRFQFMFRELLPSVGDYIVSVVFLTTA